MEVKVQAGEILKTQEMKTYQVWGKWHRHQEKHFGMGQKLPLNPQVERPGFPINQAEAQGETFQTTVLSQLVEFCKSTKWLYEILICMTHPETEYRTGLWC